MMKKGDLTKTFAETWALGFDRGWFRCLEYMAKQKQAETEVSLYSGA